MWCVTVLNRRFHDHSSPDVGCANREGCIGIPTVKRKSVKLEFL